MTVENLNKHYMPALLHVHPYPPWRNQPTQPVRPPPTSPGQTVPVPPNTPYIHVHPPSPMLQSNTPGTNIHPSTPMHGSPSQFGSTPHSTASNSLNPNLHTPSPGGSSTFSSESSQFESPSPLLLSKDTPPPSTSSQHHSPALSPLNLKRELLEHVDQRINLVARAYVRELLTASMNDLD